VQDVGTLIASAGLMAWRSTGDLFFNTQTGAIVEAIDGGADAGLIPGMTLRAANASPTTWETTAGVGFVRRDQDGGLPDLGLWVVRGFSHDEGVARFTGSAAAIIVSAGDLQVGPRGVLDVGARGTQPGPGGLRGGRVLLDSNGSTLGGTQGDGCGSGTGAVIVVGTRYGGGGGGYGTNGATAFPDSGVPDAGLAGGRGEADRCLAFRELAVLQGGPGGGAGTHGSGIDGNVFFGGAGGGALQLSATGVLRLEGKVTAGGGGGRCPIGNGRMGSGGGAGGAVLLEGALVEVVGGVYANGGAGSPDSPSSSNRRPPFSSDGTASLTPAPGVFSNRLLADGGLEPQTNGGAGAAGSMAATLGSSIAAGAGGGLGRIVVRQLTCGAPTVGPAAELSPGPGQSAFVTSPP
jgi:hypothetical protein